jgi:AraC family transcriptional regulator, positive regulator of tynA and feaB
MSVAFTTDGLNEHDRIPFWIDVASRAFFNHSFKASVAGFAASLDGSKLGNMLLSTCVCAPCEVTRSARDARDGIDDYILSVRLKGRSLFEQGERRVIIEPGMIFIQDCSKPLRIEFIEPSTSFVVNIPRQEFDTRLTTSEGERVLSTSEPKGGIASEFMQALGLRVASIETALHDRLEKQAADIIALAFAGSDGATPLSSARAQALRRLKGEIDRRLSDPGLRPADAAAGAGISVRYANALLAEENSSVERYILQRRLERCRRTLEDPLQAHRMIGEVAFAWGFSDHSHFTRRFRAAYGMTPADCRRRQQADGST